MEGKTCVSANFPKANADLPKESTQKPETVSRPLPRFFPASSPVHLSLLSLDCRRQVARRTWRPLGSALGNGPDVLVTIPLASENISAQLCSGRPEKDPAVAWVG